MSNRDTSSPSGTSPKRGRGRPKGSAPFREDDLKHLSQFADQVIRTPGMALAPFLARQGYSGSATRRAQAVWRNERSRLLESAKLRFDSREPENLGAVFFQFVALFGQIGKAVVESDLAQSLRQSMSRAEAAKIARETLGLPSPLPFNPLDLDELTAALGRFEPEMHPVDSPELRARLSDRTMGELPLSERTYLLAVTLHEFSLDQKRRERETEIARGGRTADAQSKQGSPK